MHIVVGGILEKDGKVLLVQEAQEKRKKTGVKNEKIYSTKRF